MDNPGVDSLQGPAHLNKALIASVYDHKYTDPGKRANALAGGWHSTTQDIVERPGFPELLAFIAGYVEGRRLQYVWTIVNPTGVGNPRHPHDPTMLSFCYYPRASRAAIVFYDPEGVEHRIEPVAGLLLRFPGHIPHRVETNPGPDDRIVIACDFEPV